MTVILLTILTLVAFAANSLLCRMALGAHLIDPVSFTTLRLVSGALVLAPVSLVSTPSQIRKTSNGSWVSGFALFAYAVGFSLAYVSLDTGIGALFLFGSVQVTMIAAAVQSGEHLGAAQWLGSLAAVGGLVVLVLPGISAPDPVGALLMCLAGISWGVYSIRGKRIAAPIPTTAGNFLRAAPMALGASVVAFTSMRLNFSGIMLALVSGAVTSGLGYVLWYRAVGSLTTLQASIAQLLVPVLAAFGGVLFLSEDVSVRLISASSLILGGVAVAVFRHAFPANYHTERLPKD